MTRIFLSQYHRKGNARLSVSSVQSVDFFTTDFTDYTDASLAECEFCLTQRTQNAQRHASFLLRVAFGVLDFRPRMTRMTRINFVESQLASRPVGCEQRDA